jgi:hypothetical protein
LQLTFVESAKAAESFICLAETMEENRTETPSA